MQQKLIAKNKTRQNLLQKIINYWHLPKTLAYTQNIGVCSKCKRLLRIYALSQNVCVFSKYMHMSGIYAHVKNICAFPKYMLISKIYAPKLCGIVKLLRHIYTRRTLKSLRLSTYMRPSENRRPNSYYLGSAESPTSDFFQVWLKSSRSGDVVSPPCSPQVI